MKLGVVFPQTEIGNDPLVVRDYAQAAEALGYDHLLVFDHVVGGHPDHFQNQRPPPYTHESAFHEPFVLFGYLAGLTTRLELVVGVLVLPQRQTALVAKQAAEVQSLSQGRLRLGVGIGWNFVEYEALGERFTNRGARIEEQVTLLRQLWAHDVIDFNGKYHTVHQAGINPRPARPIPLWMGGTADVVLQRTARLADGWFPQAYPAQSSPRCWSGCGVISARPGGSRTNSASRDASPSPKRRKPTGGGRAGLARPRADYLCVNTMRAGLASPQAHIDAIRRFKEVVGS